MELQTYKVRDPSGNLREIRGPVGASDEEVIAQAQKLFADVKPAAARTPDALDNPNMATEGMSGPQKLAAGVGQSVYNAGRGLGQLVGLVSEDDVKDSRSLDKPLLNTGAGMAGSIAGNIGMALLPGAALKGAGVALGKIPAAARVAEALSAAGGAVLAPKTIPAAAAVGGAMGLAQPAENTQERVINTLMGGGISAGAQALPRAVGRVFSPQTRPEAKALLDEGVSLTPGQIMGGAAQRIEEGMTSVPVVGDAIKGAQRRGMVSFDRAAMNRALEPIGQKLPKDLQGRAAVEHVQAVLGDAYDNLLPKLTGDLNAVRPANALPAAAGQPARPTLLQELDVIRQMGSELPEAQARQLNKIIDKEIIGRFTSSGKASGETLKNIESELGQLGKTFARSDDYDVRTLGGAVKEMQAALRRMVEDVNPGYGKELAAINSGYANFKRVQKAAASLGANEGVFTPAQLQNAVKAMDRSKDKGRFAVSDALMQDLSEAGKSVLGSKVPDSGTPLRLMSNAGMLGGGFMLSPTAATTGLGVAAAYSEPAQKVLQALLAQRPEIMRQLGPKIAATAPYAAGAAIPASRVIDAMQE